jgi:hypothetical protein
MSANIFSNKYLFQSIVELLDTPTQLCCLSLNRRSKSNVEELQTRMRPEQAKKIVDLFTPQVVKQLGGRDRLLAAPVLNLTGSGLLSPNLHPGCFRGPIAIGQQGTLPFLAFKIHYLKSSCCGSEVVKRSVGILTQTWTEALFYFGDTTWRPDPAVFHRLAQGEAIERNLRIEDVERAGSACCCSELCSMLLSKLVCLPASSTHRTYKLVLGS